MSSPTDNQILNSWKEIASYLNRGVRTVQRWEVELALPVRRPRGKRRSGVFALRNEIDGWLTRAPLDNGHAPDLVEREGTATTTDLILRSRQLRAEAARMESHLADTVARLVRNCEITASLTQRGGGHSPRS